MNQSQMNSRRTLTSKAASFITIVLVAGSLAGVVRAQQGTTDRPEDRQKQSDRENESVSASEAQAVVERVFASSDPAGTYSKLDEAERRKFIAAMTPGDVKVSEAKTPVGAKAPATRPSVFAGCWALHQVAEQPNILHKTLYTYWQTTNVCTAGGKVSRVWVTDAGGETKSPGWRIDKRPDTSTKNVGWEGRGVAQYHFVLGVGGWDIDHPADCLQMRLNANGYDNRTLLSCDLAAR